MNLDPKHDIDSIMKKDINTLSVDELKLRLKEVEKKGEIFARQNKPISDLSPDDLVTIHIPESPYGDDYLINEVKYGPGAHTVKLRVARQLQSMVSENWKIEREKLMSRSNRMTGALMRGDELARVERFEQILAED